MGVTTFVIFASIVVLHFHLHDSRQPLPFYNRYVLLGFLAPAMGVGLPLCKKNKGMTGKVCRDRGNTKEVLGGVPQDLEGPEEPGKFAHEWRLAACALNRFFFLVYFCTTAVLMYSIFTARKNTT